MCFCAVFRRRFLFNWFRSILLWQTTSTLSLHSLCLQCDDVSFDICTFGAPSVTGIIFVNGNSTFVPGKSYRESHQHAMFAMCFFSSSAALPSAKEMINWWTHVWQTYRLCHRRRYVRLHRECHRGRPCRSHRPHRLYLFIDCVFIYNSPMTDNLATPKLPGTPSKPGSPGIPSRPSNPGLPGMLEMQQMQLEFYKILKLREFIQIVFSSPFWPSWSDWSFSAGRPRHANVTAIAFHTRLTRRSGCKIETHRSASSIPTRESSDWFY